MTNLFPPNPKLRRRIQSGLLALGLELRRIPQPTRSNRQAETLSPSRTRFIVELIGPSGVGKSTFLEYLKATTSSEDNFDVPRGHLRLRRRSKIRKSWEKNGQNLLELWALHLERTNRDWEDPWSVETWDAKVLREGWNPETLTASRSIVTDHSLAYFFKDALRSLFSHRKDLFDEIICNRAVVVCHVDPSLAVQRILKRTSEGVTRGFHIGKTDDELLELAQRGLHNWVEYGEWLASKGIPALTLDLSSSPQASKAKLQEFVRSLG